MLRTYHYYLKKYCRFWCQKCLRRAVIRIIRFQQRRDLWSCACWQRRSIWHGQDRISRKILKYFMLFKLGLLYSFIIFLYSCNKCSVCCQILGGLEFTLKWQNYSFNESPIGARNQLEYFLPAWWLIQHCL